MSITKVGVLLTTSAFSFAIAATPAFASHSACTVLTADKVSKIMQFPVKIDTTGSNEGNCYFNGPGRFSLQFHIISENASSQGFAMLSTRRGSSPPVASGLVGGSYLEGKVMFAVAMRSTDQAKLQALVASIRPRLH